jgi:hypothetical protein
MEGENRKSLFRWFFFLHPSSHGSHPLSSILHPRSSILLLLSGILLAGAGISGTGSTNPPTSESQSANSDLHAEAPSHNLNVDNDLPETDTESQPPPVVTKDAPANEALSESQKHTETAQPDPPLDLAPDLPPDEPMPKVNPEPKINQADPEPAKDIPDPPVQEKSTIDLGPLPKEDEPASEKESEVQPASAVIAETEPELDDTVRDLHRGDTPMRHTWRILGLNALLSAALTASPALAADSDKLIDKDKQDLAEIKRLLEGISKSLTSLDRMEREIEDLRFDREVTVKSMKAEFLDLKKQVAKMREDMDKLVNPDGSRRTAFSSPGLTGMGTIKLVSTYMEPVSVTINDRVYEVPPGQTVLLNREPAGRFTYEVPISGRKATRTLAANETFTITLYPQQ